MTKIPFVCHGIFCTCSQSFSIYFMMKYVLSISLCLTASSLMAQENIAVPTLDDVENATSLIPLKTPATEEEDATIYNKDNSYALVFINKKRVWRYETRGDYELRNIKSGKVRSLGKGLPESSLMFAKFSPDGKKVAYVSQNNIYVESVDDDKWTQVTNDGNDTIVNGTFDWVYEEEFDCRDGFRWCGDSRHIAYWQSNTAGTGWFDIINNIDSIYPTVKPFPYPKAGTTNSAVKVGVLDINTCFTQWIDLPGNPRENYIPRMQVIPETNTLLVQQMNRTQSHNVLWEIAEDLNPRVLIEDSDSAWVETNDDIRFLKGNRFFTFYSERDGWRHLYRITADGKEWNCITNAPMDVVREVAFDAKRDYVYFIATPEDQATERYLYRARIMGNGDVEGPLLLGDREHGQYSYTMNKEMNEMTEKFSSAATPTQYRRVTLGKNGQWHLGKMLEDNHEAKEKADSLHLSAKEFVKVKSGDYMLDAWILKPYNFDPTKKYPVINYVYGEPASATVQNRWYTTLFWQYLASQGYVVVSIENRGANTPRGRKWRKCIYGRIGVQGSEDQKNGILYLCEKYPWMDRDRLGITGWSGGGSSTLHAMFRYPDVWKTGVAIAPVTDLKLYDTIYEERYMNTPQANPDGYYQGSAINFTEGLKGNLLLIHGTGDDNVHYQNMEMLVNKLVENGKLFYEISYPMRTHNLDERAGTSRHLRMQIADFFRRNL